MNGKLTPDPHQPPLRKGDRIVIVKGPYKGLGGYVLRLEPERAGLTAEMDRLNPFGTSNLGGWAWEEVELEGD